MKRYAWLFVLASCSCGCKSWGEAFIDLYIGPNSVEEDNLRVERSAGSSSMPIEIDRGIGVGARIGDYLDLGIPIQPGASLDASYNYFEVEDDAASAVLFSLLAMARWPLGVSEDHPNGLVRPYVAAGPSLAIVDLLNDLEAAGVDIHNQDVAIGLDVRGGVSAVITRRVGVFAEYRYTSSRLKFDAVSAGEQVDTELDLRIHHVQLGVSFTF